MFWSRYNILSEFLRMAGKEAKFERKEDRRISMGMSQYDLKIGIEYSNGKKRESVRRLLGFPACENHWTESVCVRYLVIKGSRLEVGKEYTVSRRRFARWVHHEVRPMELSDLSYR